MLIYIHQHVDEGIFEPYGEAGLDDAALFQSVFFFLSFFPCDLSANHEVNAFMQSDFLRFSQKPNQF